MISSNILPWHPTTSGMDLSKRTAWKGPQHAQIAYYRGSAVDCLNTVDGG
jgi:hypothetical protein